MEHEQQAESVCKFIKTEQIYEHDAGEADVCAGGGPEDAAVDGLGGVGVHEDGEAHGEAADDEADVVEVQPVDPGSVAEPAQAQPRHRVGDPYDGEEEGGGGGRDAPGLGPVHREHVRHVEADAGEEVAGGEHHEDGVLEQAEVHHLQENHCLLRINFEAATRAAWVSLGDSCEGCLLTVQH